MNLEEFLALNLESEDVQKRFPQLVLTKEECKEVQSIVKHRDIGKLLDKPCDKCGEKQVYCGYADLGGVDYYDNYWHICLSCLDAKHKEDYNQSGMEPAETPCPFPH